MGSLGQPTALGQRSIEIKKKYDEERFRRYRADGAAQFVDTTRSEKFKHFAADPWYDPKLPPRGRQDVPENGHTRFLVIGAGFGAILFAARLIDAGVSAQDMTLVDASNGFGGAWYWNRYPGLMCDVESSIYMPLLEETGYVPKHRYSYGTELRQYAESCAVRLNLEANALFRSSVQSSDWDEARSEWVSRISKKRADGTDFSFTMRSDFLILASGILVHPKLPLIPGIEDFRGHTFHTARWDYQYTGGSVETPELTNLRDKKVAIIGTGATAIQVVPKLAEWAGKLYLFQRTASSVDARDQRPIDPKDFAATCHGAGWQQRRRENFASFLANSPTEPGVDLVNDGWTGFPSYSGLIGNPVLKTMPVEEIPAYVNGLYEMDLPRQERIRARVDEIVRDKNTAEGLKAWYPGWCKRPCFHDDYLPAFNKPNVELVDTKGLGVDRITEGGLSFGGKDFDVDVIIFSTGFEPWGAGSPAHRAGMKITGRGGLTMDDKWARDLGTFQGLFTRSFPNLILSGGTQAAPAANQVHMMDVYSTHVARIIKRAQDKVGEGAKAVIEPTAEGEGEWTRKIMEMAHGLAPIVDCTPSYLTNEAQLSKFTSPEEKAAMARRAPWTPGLSDYCREIDTWAAQDGMPGLDVQSVLVKST